jgi:dCTP deaminase
MSPVLNDKELKRLLAEGEKIVDPFEENNAQPASIDLRLGNIKYEYNLEKYVLGEEITDDQIDQQRFDKLILQGGDVAFVGIYEKMSIPENTIGVVFPRSSITRLGVQVVSTYMNPGYRGNMPLTIINHTRHQITLKPGYRVAQLVLFSLNEEPSKTYKKVVDCKYFDERVKPSRLNEDAELAELTKTFDAILEKDAPILRKMVKKSSSA